jgi:hypothetical protein
MNIIKKIHKIITGYKTKEAEGAEVWMVSWYARYGEYSGDYKKVAKAFLNEDDADAFAESLEEAAKLLQYTEDICIKVEKQK